MQIEIVKTRASLKHKRFLEQQLDEADRVYREVNHRGNELSMDLTTLPKVEARRSRGS